MEIRSSDAWNASVHNERLQNDWRKIDKHRQQFPSLYSSSRRLRHCIEQNKEDIDDLQQDRETILERFDRLQQKTDATEMETKRSNLKFIEIKEPQRGKSYTSGEQQMVDVLNEFSTSPCWQREDINRAFRIDDPQQRSDQPSSHSTVLQMEGKDGFTERPEAARHVGIKVTSDLTSRHRSTHDFYRSQGKIAYYCKGRLHFTNRQQFFPRRR